MKIQELKEELENRLTDIKLNIREIQNGIDEKEAPTEELEDVLVKLKALQEDLILQHDQLVALETEGEKLNVLERNIWTNLETFDATFSKAGAIMKPGKFKNRERSVDFKNPTGTK
jgi:DNA repair exonuclease SbcCD ATPase subunit